MRRSAKKISINGGKQSRHSITLSSDPVVAGALDMFQKQHDMLRTLVEQPEMMNCGPARFEKLRMFFTGSEWVVEMESVVEEGNNNGSPTL
jgi:ATP-dependent Zn protease